MDFSKLGLTPEQKAARLTGIGGSDAGKIMSGDWLPLWEEKTGRKPGPDLSDVFEPNLGTFTEPFNLYWLAKQHPEWQIEVATRETRRRSDAPHLLAHPDAFGLVNGSVAVVDAKHTNPWPGKAYENREQRVSHTYFWQLVHNVHVCGAAIGILSPIYGNNWGPAILHRIDDETIARYLERANAFWSCVESDTAPEGEIEADEELPVDPAQLKTVNMEGNNAWGDMATTYLESKSAAAAYKDAESGLKALVDKDVGLAFGHGLQIKRNKAGALRLTVMKQEAAE